MSVRDVHLNSNDFPVVLLFQDVHQNTAAQKNIGAALNWVHGATQSSSHDFVVGVEAAKGAFEFSPFRVFPDEGALQNIGDYLLKENLVSAVSWFGLTAKTPLPQVMGVDEPSLYLENVNAYKKAAPLKAELARQIEIASFKLKALGESILPPELAELYKSESAFQDRTKSIYEHVGLLSELTGLAPYPNLKKLLEAVKIEKDLDPPLAGRERERLLGKLAASNQGDLKPLIKLSLSYQAGEVEAFTYYKEFVRIIEGAGIKLEKYPHLSSYLEYLNLADSISQEAVFSEIRSLTQSAINQWARNQGERDFFAESRQLYLAKKIVNFELTPEEWGEYKNTVPSSLFLVPRNNPSNSRNQEPGTRNASSLFPFEEFYSTAGKRDEAMTSNLLGALKKEKSPVAVFVAGGFHTPGAVRAFERSKLSYVVLSPKFSLAESSGGGDYLDVFVREKTPLAKLFYGEKLTLASADRLMGARPFAGIKCVALPVFVVLLGAFAVKMNVPFHLAASAIAAASLGYAALKGIKGNRAILGFGKTEIEIGPGLPVSDPSRRITGVAGVGDVGWRVSRTTAGILAFIGLALISVLAVILMVPPETPLAVIHWLNSGNLSKIGYSVGIVLVGSVVNGEEAYRKLTEAIRGLLEPFRDVFRPEDLVSKDVLDLLKERPSEIWDKIKANGTWVEKGVRLLPQESKIVFHRKIWKHLKQFSQVALAKDFQEMEPRVAAWILSTPDVVPSKAKAILMELSKLIGEDGTAQVLKFMDGRTKQSIQEAKLWDVAVLSSELRGSKGIPLYKTGGMGDVSRDLPEAEWQLGHNSSMFMPGYKFIFDNHPQARPVLGKDGKPLRVRVPLGEKAVEWVDVWQETQPNGPPIYFIRNHRFEENLGSDPNGRPNPYLPAKDLDPSKVPADVSPELYAEYLVRERFLFYSKALLFVLMELGELGEIRARKENGEWEPMMFHGNDWQTGILMALINFVQNASLEDLVGYKTFRGYEHMKGWDAETFQRLKRFYADTATNYTVHNELYDGLFPQEMVYFNAPKIRNLSEGLFRLTGLPWDPYFVPGNHLSGEFHGQLNYLIWGIQTSRIANTVSENHAVELAELLGDEQSRRFFSDQMKRLDHFSGILNGIGDRWDPEEMEGIFNFNSETVKEGKPKNKESLQKNLTLPLNPDAPLIGFIGRLVDEKGIELMVDAVSKILWENPDAQIVFLGTGDEKWHKQLEALAGNPAFAGRLRIILAYDEKLADQMYAGLDMLWMPSLKEPCGLNQLMAMRLGTVPIVTPVGGLFQSVTDESAGYKHATGFVLEVSPSSLVREKDDINVTWGRKLAAAKEALANATKKAIKIYRERNLPDNGKWWRLVGNGMEYDSSWEHTVGEYLGLYGLATRRPNVVHLGTLLNQLMGRRAREPSFSSVLTLKSLYDFIQTFVPRFRGEEGLRRYQKSFLGAALFEGILIFALSLLYLGLFYYLGTGWVSPQAGFAAFKATAIATAVTTFALHVLDDATVYLPPFLERIGRSAEWARFFAKAGGLRGGPNPVVTFVALSQNPSEPPRQISVPLADAYQLLGIKKAGLGQIAGSLIQGLGKYFLKSVLPRIIGTALIFFLLAYGPPLLIFANLPVANGFVSHVLALFVGAALTIPAHAPWNRVMDRLGLAPMGPPLLFGSQRVTGKNPGLAGEFEKALLSGGKRPRAIRVRDKLEQLLLRDVIVKLIREGKLKDWIQYFPIGVRLHKGTETKTTYQQYVDYYLHQMTGGNVEPVIVGLTPENEHQSDTAGIVHSNFLMEQNSHIASLFNPDDPGAVIFVTDVGDKTRMRAVSVGAAHQGLIPAFNQIFISYQLLDLAVCAAQLPHQGKGWYLEGGSDQATIMEDPKSGEIPLSELNRHDETKEAEVLFFGYPKRILNPQQEKNLSRIDWDGESKLTDHQRELVREALGEDLGEVMKALQGVGELGVMRADPKSGKLVKFIEKWVDMYKAGQINPEDVIMAAQRAGAVLMANMFRSAWTHSAYTDRMNLANFQIRWKNKSWRIRELYAPRLFDLFGNLAVLDRQVLMGEDYLKFVPGSLRKTTTGDIQPNTTDHREHILLLYDLVQAFIKGGTVYKYNRKITFNKHPIHVVNIGEGAYWKDAGKYGDYVAFNRDVATKEIGRMYAMLPSLNKHRSAVDCFIDLRADASFPTDPDSAAFRVVVRGHGKVTLGGDSVLSRVFFGPKEEDEEIVLGPNYTWIGGRAEGSGEFDSRRGYENGGLHVDFNLLRSLKERNFRGGKVRTSVVGRNREKNFEPVVLTDDLYLPGAGDAVSFQPEKFGPNVKIGPGGFDHTFDEWREAINLGATFDLRFRQEEEVRKWGTSPILEAQLEGNAIRIGNDIMFVKMINKGRGIPPDCFVRYANKDDFGWQPLVIPTKAGTPLPAVGRSLNLGGKQVYLTPKVGDKGKLHGWPILEIVVSKEDEKEPQIFAMAEVDRGKEPTDIVVAYGGEDTFLGDEAVFEEIGDSVDGNGHKLEFMGKFVRGRAVWEPPEAHAARLQLESFVFNPTAVAYTMGPEKQGLDLESESILIDGSQEDLLGESLRHLRAWQSGLMDRKDVPKIFVWPPISQPALAGFSFSEQVSLLEKGLGVSIGEVFPYVLVADWTPDKIAEWKSAMKETKYPARPVVVADSEIEMLKHRGLKIIKTSEFEFVEGQVRFKQGGVQKIADDLKNLFLLRQGRAADPERQFLLAWDFRGSLTSYGGPQYLEEFSALVHLGIQNAIMTNEPFEAVADFLKKAGVRPPAGKSLLVVADAASRLYEITRELEGADSVLETSAGLVGVREDKKFGEGQLFDGETGEKVRGIVDDAVNQVFRRPFREDREFQERLREGYGNFNFSNGPRVNLDGSGDKRSRVVIRNFPSEKYVEEFQKRGVWPANLPNVRRDLVDLINRRLDEEFRGSQFRFRIDFIGDEYIQIRREPGLPGSPHEITGKYAAAVGLAERLQVKPDQILWVADQLHLVSQTEVAGRPLMEAERAIEIRKGEMAVPSADYLPGFPMAATNSDGVNVPEGVLWLGSGLSGAKKLASMVIDAFYKSEAEMPAVKEVHQKLTETQEDFAVANGIEVTLPGKTGPPFADEGRGNSPNDGPPTEGSSALTLVWLYHLVAGFRPGFRGPEGLSRYKTSFRGAALWEMIPIFLLLIGTYALFAGFGLELAPFGLSLGPVYSAVVTSGAIFFALHIIDDLIINRAAIRKWIISALTWIIMVTSSLGTRAGPARVRPAPAFPKINFLPYVLNTFSRFAGTTLLFSFVFGSAGFLIPQIPAPTEFLSHLAVVGIFAISSLATNIFHAPWNRLMAYLGGAGLSPAHPTVSHPTRTNRFYQFAEGKGMNYEGSFRHLIWGIVTLGAVKWFYSYLPESAALYILIFVILAAVGQFAQYSTLLVLSYFKLKKGIPKGPAGYLTIGFLRKLGALKIDQLKLKYPVLGDLSYLFHPSDPDSIFAQVPLVKIVNLATLDPALERKKVIVINNQNADPFTQAISVPLVFVRKFLLPLPRMPGGIGNDVLNLGLGFLRCLSYPLASIFSFGISVVGFVGWLVSLMYFRLNKRKKGEILGRKLRLYLEDYEDPETGNRYSPNDIKEINTSPKVVLHSTHEIIPLGDIVNRLPWHEALSLIIKARPPLSPNALISRNRFYELVVTHADPGQGGVGKIPQQKAELEALPPDKVQIIDLVDKDPYFNRGRFRAKEALAKGEVAVVRNMGGAGRRFVSKSLRVPWTVTKQIVESFLFGFGKGFKSAIVSSLNQLYKFVPEGGMVHVALVTDQGNGNIVRRAITEDPNLTFRLEGDPKVRATWHPLNGIPALHRRGGIRWVELKDMAPDETETGPDRTLSSPPGALAAIMELIVDGTALNWAKGEAGRNRVKYVLIPNGDDVGGIVDGNVLDALDSTDKSVLFALVDRVVTFKLAGIHEGKPWEAEVKVSGGKTVVDKKGLPPGMDVEIDPHYFNVSKWDATALDWASPAVSEIEKMWVPKIFRIKGKKIVDYKVVKLDFEEGGTPLFDKTRGKAVIKDDKEITYIPKFERDVLRYKNHFYNTNTAAVHLVRTLRDLKFWEGDEDANPEVALKKAINMSAQERRLHIQRLLEKEQILAPANGELAAASEVTFHTIAFKLSDLLLWVNGGFCRIDRHGEKTLMGYMALKEPGQIHSIPQLEDMSRALRNLMVLVAQKYEKPPRHFTTLAAAMLMFIAGSLIINQDYWRPNNWNLKGQIVEEQNRKIFNLLINVGGIDYPGTVEVVDDKRIDLDGSQLPDGVVPEIDPKNIKRDYWVPSGVNWPTDDPKMDSIPVPKLKFHDSTVPFRYSVVGYEEYKKQIPEDEEPLPYARVTLTRDGVLSQIASDPDLQESHKGYINAATGVVDKDWIPQAIRLYVNLLVLDLYRKGWQIVVQKQQEGEKRGIQVKTTQDDTQVTFFIAPAVDRAGRSLTSVPILDFEDMTGLLRTQYGAQVESVEEPQFVDYYEIQKAEFNPDDLQMREECLGQLNRRQITAEDLAGSHVFYKPDGTPTRRGGITAISRVPTDSRLYAQFSSAKRNLLEAIDNLNAFSSEKELLKRALVFYDDPHFTIAGLEVEKSRVADTERANAIGVADEVFELAPAKLFSSFRGLFLHPSLRVVVLLGLPKGEQDAYKLMRDQIEREKYDRVNNPNGRLNNPRNPDGNYIAVARVVNPLSPRLFSLFGEALQSVANLQFDNHFVEQVELVDHRTADLSPNKVTLLKSYDLNSGAEMEFDVAPPREGVKAEPNHFAPIDAATVASSREKLRICATREGISPENEILTTYYDIRGTPHHQAGVSAITWIDLESPFGKKIYAAQENLREAIRTGLPYVKESDMEAIRRAVRIYDNAYFILYGLEVARGPISWTKEDNGRFEAVANERIASLPASSLRLAHGYDIQFPSLRIVKFLGASPGERDAIEYVRNRLDEEKMSPDNSTGRLQNPFHPGGKYVTLGRVVGKLNKDQVQILSQILAHLPDVDLPEVLINQVDVVSYPHPDLSPKTVKTIAHFNLRDRGSEMPPAEEMEQGRGVRERQPQPPIYYPGPGTPTPPKVETKFQPAERLNTLISLFMGGKTMDTNSGVELAVLVLKAQGVVPIPAAVMAFLGGLNYKFLIRSGRLTVEVDTPPRDIEMIIGNVLNQYRKVQPDHLTEDKSGRALGMMAKLFIEDENLYPLYETLMRMVEKRFGMQMLAMTKENLDRLGRRDLAMPLRRDKDYMRGRIAEDPISSKEVAGSLGWTEAKLKEVAQRELKRQEGQAVVLDWRFLITLEHLKWTPEATSKVSQMATTGAFGLVLGWMMSLAGAPLIVQGAFWMAGSWALVAGLAAWMRGNFNSVVAFTDGRTAVFGTVAPPFRNLPRWLLLPHRLEEASHFYLRSALKFLGLGQFRVWRKEGASHLLTLAQLAGLGLGICLLLSVTPLWAYAGVIPVALVGLRHFRMSQSGIHLDSRVRRNYDLHALPRLRQILAEGLLAAKENNLFTEGELRNLLEAGGLSSLGPPIKSLDLANWKDVSPSLLARLSAETALPNATETELAERRVVAKALQPILAGRVLDIQARLARRDISPDEACDLLAGWAKVLGIRNAVSGSDQSRLEAGILTALALGLKIPADRSALKTYGKDISRTSRKFGRNVLPREESPEITGETVLYYSWRDIKAGLALTETGNDNLREQIEKMAKLIALAEERKDRKGGLLINVSQAELGEVVPQLLALLAKFNLQSINGRIITPAVLSRNIEFQIMNESETKANPYRALKNLNESGVYEVDEFLAVPMNLDNWDFDAASFFELGSRWINKVIVQFFDLATGKAYTLQGSIQAALKTLKAA